MAKLVLLLALVAGALAGPLTTGQLPRCSSQCTVSPLQKYMFKPHTTYTYQYEGSSYVKLEGSNQAETELEWTAEVELSFITPCDVAVQIVSQKFKGQQQVREYEEQLTKYPVVVAMSDGTVTSVCADPHDMPVSLNMKKGIISSIQNTLPSLSHVHSGKTFIETDVAGRCPTKYDVKSLSESVVIVEKTKQHRSCEERLSSQGNVPFASFMLKTPLPLEESHSKCEQKIENGLPKEVECQDINVVKPYLGSSKYIQAVQKSKLVLKGEKKSIQVSSMSGMRYTNLTSEYLLEPKREEVVPEVKQILRELCSKVEPQVEKDSARVLAQLIGLLYRVPEQQVKSLLTQIKQGQFCSKSEKLEEIYLDAIAFTNNAGAVEIMVEKILSEEKIGGYPLYTIALHLVKRPCIHTVRALIPLIESRRTPSTVLLAAGSVVGKYMKEHQYAEQEPIIREFMEKLAQRLESSYQSASQSQEKKIEALAVLKTIRNMANMTGSLEQQVLRVVKSQNTPVSVRIAAAQAFDKSNCTVEMSKTLMYQALKKQEPTEVRIASYLAGIRCSSYEESARLVHEIKQEPSSQVRSFILSHLRNYQSNDAPYLQDQRYNLSAFAIPMDYETDLRRFSRNIDLSYYLPSFGLGAGVDTNVIYAPNSYIPKQLQTNITLDLLRNVINIGEFGIRVEDLEELIEMFVGHLKDTPVQTIVENVNQLMNQHGKSIKTLLGDLLKSSEGTFKIPSLEQIMSKWSKREHSVSGPSIDAFTRIFGREIFFLSSKLGKPSVEVIDKVVEDVIEIAASLFVQLLKPNVEVTRAFQINNEYFVPTVQGIPLQLKYVATAVAGVKASSQSNFVNNKFHIVPELSMHLNGFVGYALGAKTGLRQNATVYSSAEYIIEADLTSQEVTLKLDLPRKSEPLYFQSEVYMMKKLPGKQDQKQPIPQYEKYQKSECSQKLEKVLGLKSCMHVESPKYSKTNVFPLGVFKFILTSEKTQQQKGLLTTKVQHTLSKREGLVKIEVVAPGAQNKLKMDTKLSYEYTPRHSGSSIIYVTIPEAEVKRAVKLQYETTSTPSGKMVEFNVYTDKTDRFSSSNKVIELIVGGGKAHEEVHGQFVLKTMRPLSQYVAADIELEASMKLNPRIPYHIPEKYRQYLRFLPRSLDLKRFEVDLTILEELKTVNYIRKNSDQNGASYVFQFKNSVGPTVLTKFEGQGRIQGHLEYLNVLSSLQAQAKIGKKSFETEAEFTLNKKESKTLFLVKQKSEKVFLIESQIQNMQESEKTFKAQLEIPKVLPKYSVEGKLSKQNKETSKINFSLMKRDQPIFEVKGPISLIINRQQFKQESHLVLKAYTPETKQYEIRNKIDFSQQQKEGFLEILKENQQVVKMETIFKQREERQYSVSSALKIREVFDFSSQLQKSQDQYELKMTTHFLPQRQESRKYVSEYVLNTQQQTYRASIAYDVERDPSKKVTFDGQYQISPAERLAKINGQVVYKQKQYSYQIEAVLDALRAHRPHNARNILVVKLTNPSQETFEFDVKQTVIRQSREKYEVELSSQMKSFERQIYNVYNKYQVQYSELPYVLKTQGESKVKVWEYPQYTITIDQKISTPEKEAKFEIEVSKPSMRKPLRFEFQVSKQSRSAEAKVVLDLQSVAEVRFSSNGLVKMQPESQYPQEIQFKTEMKLPRTPEYVMKVYSTPRKPVDIQLTKGSEDILKVNYVSTRQGEWEIRAFVPSNKMEIRSGREESVMSVGSSERQEDRYEVRVSHQRKQGFTSESINSLIRLRVPGRQNQYRLRLNVELTKEKKQGVIELDIFEKESDKIIIDVQTSKLESRTYEMTADIRVPRLRIEPRLVSAISYSPDLKRVDFAVLKKGDIKKPTIDVSLVYTKTAPENGNLYALLRTSQEKYEATAVIQPHQSFSCRGKSLNGTIQGTTFEPVKFVSSVCAPAYIEFGAAPAKSPEMFVTKVGMKNPASIKLAIDKVYRSWNYVSFDNVNALELTYNKYGSPAWVPKQPVALVGAKLFTPMMVSVATKYNVSAIERYIKAYERASQIIVRSAEEVQQSIVQDLRLTLRQEGSVELAQELEQMFEKLYKQFEQLREQIKRHLPTQETFEEMKQEIRDIYQEIQKILRWVSQEAKKYIHEYTGMSIEEIEQKLEKLEIRIKEIIKEIRKYLLKTVKKVELEGINILRMNLNEIEVPTFIKEAFRGSFWDWIVNHYHQLIHTFQHEIQAFKDWIKGFWHNLAHDIEKFIHHMMEFGPFKKVIDWIISWFHPRDDYDYSYIRSTEGKQHLTIIEIIARVLGLYVTPRAGSISVQVPLKTRVSSLQAASVSVGLPHYLYRLPTGVRSRNAFFSTLMSAYSRPAVLTNEEVETFNGLIIPVIPSDCEILLVETQQGAKILLKQYNQEKKQVIIEDPSDRKLVFTMEKHQPIQTPYMHRPEYQSRQMNLTMESPYRMKVDLKEVQIRLEGSEVEVIPRPWSFGKLQGLMGDLSSEIANEVPRDTEVEYDMVKGKHSLSRKSARKVFEQYKQQPSCQIPYMQ